MIASKQIAFGKAAGKRKPYDAEIEYLESTGTQYFKTDIIPTVGYTYKMKFRSTGVAAYGYLFGVNWKDGAGAVKFFGLRRLASQAKFQSQGFSIGTVPYEEDIDYDITINGGEAGVLNEFRLSDGRVFSYESKINVSPTLPMNLLAVNNNGGVAYQNKVWLYSFSIESSGVLILDLIPVRKGNIGYMYDRVSGQLFGNQGTGEFVLGPDLIDYTAKDYIRDGLIRMLDSIETTGFGEMNYNDGTVVKNLATGVDSYVTIGNQVTKGQPLLTAVKSVNNAVFADPVDDIEAAFGSDAFTFEVHAVIPSDLIGVYDSSGYGNTICTINGFGTFVGLYVGGLKKSVACDTTTVHSLSMTRNGDVCKGYIDGVLCLTFDARVSDVPEQNRFYMRVNQQIGSLRFYSRALDDSEIAHNYEIDKARFGL